MIWLVLALAGFLAGLINAIAGGGSLVSFPALLLAGMPSITANATNALAVWPGSLSSVYAYRHEIGEQKARVLQLSVPSLLGSVLGSFILLHSSEQSFRAVVPFLIVLACALLALQERVSKLWNARRTAAQPGTLPPQLWFAQFAISVYGGYFGAGMGILMLAAMAIVLPGSLQHANALKVLCGLLINGIAAIYFLALGAVRLPEAGVMALAAFAGGYAGARVAQRLPAKLLRTLVIAYGLLIAARLFVSG